jgi:hypothetical protein
MNTVIHEARVVWNYTKDEIWSFNTIAKVGIRFDNGEIVESNGRSVIFSWYLGVFHRHYPKTPLLPHHHLGERNIEKFIELRILEKGLFDCIDTYGDQVDREALARLAYEAQNELYNDMSTRLKRYVSSTSILDFLELMDHPEIYNANHAYQNQTLAIELCYERIWEALINDPVLDQNNVARITKTGLVSKNQVLQCIGPRGSITDIDSTLIPKPLRTGFVQGHHSLIDGLAESRAAAKSLILSSVSIGDSEFFSRELQFICSTIARIHPGDCGSTGYLPFTVRQSDLRHIAGKYYLLENGTLAVVSKGDTGLIGRTLQLRTVLKCQHSDRYGVCEVCFGKLAKSIPHHTNIGFLSAIILCEQQSQNLLSSKHLQTSCSVNDFIVADEDQPYLEAMMQSVNPKKETIYTDDRVSVLCFKPTLQAKQPRLALTNEQAFNLSEVDYNPIDKLTPSMITRLDHVKLAFTEPRSSVEQSVILRVSNQNRYSWLTTEALEYVKHTGWVLTDQNEYLIDLSGWSFELPFFQLPMKYASAVEYMDLVKAFIKNSTSRSRNRRIKTLSGYDSVDRAVIELYELINSTLSVNIAYLETITLSMMASNPDMKDYRPPRPIEGGRIMDYTSNVNNRSLSVAMAYKHQKNRLTSHQSYLVKERPDSIFDNILEPLVINPRD